MIEPPFRRKRIRLDRQVYSWSGTVFSVTLSIADKEPIFARRLHARPVFDSIFQGPLSLRTQCYAACLMPDHLHLLVRPRACDLVWALQQWKSWTTRCVHALGWIGPVWQRSFYDHALRAEEDLKAAALYIVNNPVRSGLVGDWRSYAYSWCWGESPSR
jgi:REP element-mobilizing transposase RayT